MNKVLLAIFTILLVVSCSSGRISNSSDPANLDYKIVKKSLNNGLEVLLVENKKLPIFSYYTFYKVGGKFEYEGITGASHFLEHMMFKGAKKYGQGEFDKLVEGNGGNNNAYTTNDLTVYYENMPSEHINQIIDIEADRMANLTLEKQSFENERQVVLNERKMRYENSDRGKIFLAMMRSMFEGTPYGTSVIGNISDLNTVSRDQIYEYFKKYYAPNNALIVVVGDINTSAVMDEINEKFGQIEAFDDLDAIKKEAIKKNGGFEFKGNYDRWIKLNGQSQTPQFMLAFKGIKIGPRDAYVLDILSSILGDGKSSFLNQAFVSGKRPTFSNVGAGNYTLQDSGVFFVSGGLLEKVNLDRARKNLYKTIVNACESAINPRSVQKIKNSYLLDMLSSFESNAGIAKFFGDREVYYGDYNFYKKELENYQSVTEEELKDACKKYLKKENSIFLSIWNKHKKSGLEL